MAESIYSWIEETPQEVVKPPRYQSKHNPKAAIAGTTMSRDKRGTGTLGRVSNKPSPNKFLRSKHNKGVQGGGKAKKFVRPDAGRSKPTVPGRDQKPVMGLQTTKNFVVANAVENILAVPVQRNKQRMDFTKKKDYGRVPGYLKHVKKDIADEQAVIEQYFTVQQPNQSEGQLLSKQERDKLVYALKQKWDDTNKQYQRISHIVKLDTVGKVKRKEGFEKMLDQLEKDIRMLSSKRPIMIVEDYMMGY